MEFAGDLACGILMFDPEDDKFHTRSYCCYGFGEYGTKLFNTRVDPIGIHLLKMF